MIVDPGQSWPRFRRLATCSIGRCLETSDRNSRLGGGRERGHPGFAGRSGMSSPRTGSLRCPPPGATVARCGGRPTGVMPAHTRAADGRETGSRVSTAPAGAACPRAGPARQFPLGRSFDRETGCAVASPSPGWVHVPRPGGAPVVVAVVRGGSVVGPSGRWRSSAAQLTSRSRWAASAPAPPRSPNSRLASSR